MCASGGVALHGDKDLQAESKVLVSIWYHRAKGYRASC